MLPLRLALLARQKNKRSSLVSTFGNLKKNLSTMTAAVAQPFPATFFRAPLLMRATAAAPAPAPAKTAGAGAATPAGAVPTSTAAAAAAGAKRAGGSTQADASAAISSAAETVGQAGYSVGKILFWLFLAMLGLAVIYFVVRWVRKQNMALFNHFSGRASCGTYTAANWADALNTTDSSGANYVDPAMLTITDSCQRNAVEILRAHIIAGHNMSKSVAQFKASLHCCGAPNSAQCCDPNSAVTDTLNCSLNFETLNGTNITCDLSML